MKIFVLRQFLVRRASPLISLYIFLKPKKCQFYMKAPISMSRLSYVGDSSAYDYILELATSKSQVTAIVFLGHSLAIFYAVSLFPEQPKFMQGIHLSEEDTRPLAFSKVFCFLIVWRTFHPTHMGISSCVLHVRSAIHI